MLPCIARCIFGHESLPVLVCGDSSVFIVANAVIKQKRLSSNYNNSSDNYSSVSLSSEVRLFRASAGVYFATVWEYWLYIDSVL